MSTSALSHKALAAARLATSAEDLESYHEAAQAARTAGALALRAGLELKQFWRMVPDMSSHELTWHYVVDGWADEEARVQPAQAPRG